MTFSIDKNVRRYVYCDVVRACDINPFVDTTGVQNYIINSAKVMFLHHRPHSKLGRPNGTDVCTTCHRHLREGFSYCSLACKVEALTKGETGPATSAAATAGAASADAATASASAAPAAPRRHVAVTAAAARCPSIGGCESDLQAAVSPRSGGARASAGGASTSAGTLPYMPPSPSTSLPRKRLLAAAAAAMAVYAGRSAAAAAAASDIDADGGDSSEPGEETVPYGGSSAALTLYGRKRSPSVAAAASLLAAQSDGGSEAGADVDPDPERDASYGSGSSEDERFDFNFENPPKRRRSFPTGRRPVLAGRQDASPDASLEDGSSLEGAASAGGAASTDGAAAVAAAAVALLMPYRSASLGAGMAAALDAASAAGAATAGGLSRRKRSLPQKAPVF
ncbi:hypothetical protein GPECTOR_104g80 [Gonium pectorale]|uniref:PLATZ transcription factor n=1 Tax=Gonium pectorale TaxID=33097 RepID=A0A150FZQ2_GONPE|nr:hypothetical protein GPECTOR_104g80 [Gonium pectorale]|eukprot:KXZ43074.1 hypothetical protein GPECTOR_104g80 [Gonium pectorale]